MWKRIVVIGIFVLFTKIVLAQKNNIFVGGSVSYESMRSTPGIGIKALVPMSKVFRLDLNGSYFFPKTETGEGGWYSSSKLKTNLLEGGVNLHALLPFADWGSLYSITGVAITNEHQNNSFGGSSVNSEGTRFGGVLGGGVDCVVSQRLSIQVEGKYHLVKDYGRFVCSVGFAYRL